MKRLSAVIFILCILSFAGCGHTHDWNKATCLTPKTCADCGEETGEALGHSWLGATCTAPKSCSTCGAAEGSPLGHTWSDATCTSPKTCTTCSAAEGSPLGHDTPDLTCTTDAVCARCNVTITAPGHSFSTPTCTDPAKCSVCGETSEEALGHTVTSGVCGRCGLETYETVNGRGDDVISNITVGDGVYRIHFTHTGRRNFIVKSFDASNETELLINEIGNYDGYVLLTGKAPYAFEITADGTWTFKIERLVTISDTSFSGKGDYVTGLCSISSGAWEFTHDGSANFIVKFHTTDGWDLPINEIGNYSGKKMLTIPAGSYAIFEIKADGNWTIKQP